MADLNSALAASRDAAERLLEEAERTAQQWTTAPARGRWSPSQIVEHVSRALEESAHVASGRPSKFPNVPAVFRPIVRGLLFKRSLKNGTLPKAKTNKAMNPITGPTTLAEGRSRLQEAHRKFDAACRELASREHQIRTSMFGPVAIAEYVRFMELHTRHHQKQIAG